MQLIPFFRLPSPFFIAAGAFLGLAWLCYLAALFEVFFPWLVGLLLTLFFLGFFMSIALIVQKKEWWHLGLFTGLFLLSLLIGFTSAPTVFSGRDQGSIAEAAWRLAENGKLSFSTPVSRAFFELYGPGTALNFPGFAYTESGSLITQFPLVYTAWIAAFIIIFGIPGYTLGNLILLWLFGWGLFELLQLFVTRSLALSGTTLALFSFLPIWMTKFTLTENLGVVLFVLLSFAVVQLYRTKTVFWYNTTLALVSLFAFTRIEGFVFFLVVLGIISFSRTLRSLVLAAPITRLILPGLILSFIFLRDFFINLPFYKMIGKVVWKKWILLTHYGGIPTEGGGSLGTIFLSYGLLILFLVAFISILWLIYKKNFSWLPVFLLVSPTIIYLFLPSITFDHPWLLRRYYFSLYPAAIFFTTLALAQLDQSLRTFAYRRMVLIFSFLVLFAFQTNGFIQAIRVTENPSLLAQTESFAHRFGETDLILIDRGTSGDPYALISGPMNFIFKKQAVYFFNPQDYRELDRAPFEKVYLLLPEDSLEQAFKNFGDTLRPLETMSFVTERFQETIDYPFFPPKKVTTITNSILFEITD